MIGWLGADGYLWVKALHIVFVIFWIAGLFMLPRFLVYQLSVPVGSAEDLAWNQRNTRLKRIILGPGIVAAWVLGFMLASSYGLEDTAWLHVKIAIVFLLSGYHGWASALAGKHARGDRPVPERRLRLLNEVPAVATLAIVILVVVKPFWW